MQTLHSEPEWASGQNARTLVKFDDFRVVLITLRARARVPGHLTKGRISIQTVDGRIQMHADGRTFALYRGALLALDQGVPHDVGASEDSAFLLTIAWPSWRWPVAHQCAASSPSLSATPRATGHSLLSLGRATPASATHKCDVRFCARVTGASSGDRTGRPRGSRDSGCGVSPRALIDCCRLAR